MSNHEWQPVARLREELPDRGGDWYVGLDSEDAMYILKMETGSIYRVYLPDDLRLCRRVEVERPRDDLQARIADLEAEVARLRALLPDAETRKALRAIMEFRSDHWSRAPVAAWLEKLESEVGHNE